MKKIIFSLVIAFSLLLSAATAATPAAFGFKIKADIPFDFMVGKKKIDRKSVV